MVYLIIFVVIALILAPIFWIMPSPRQKRLMALRQRAMSLGLQVKVCDLPQTQRAKVRREDSKQGVVYRLPWTKARQAETFHHLLHREEQTSDNNLASEAWFQPLTDSLAAMPEDVIAIEYAAPGIAVYWRERGGVEIVDELHRRLVALREQLAQF